MIKLKPDHATTLAKCGNEIYLGFSWLYCAWGNRGLAVLSEGNPEEITYYTPKNSGLSNDCVTIVKREGDIIWIGTFNGLFKMDTKTKKIEKCVFSSEENEANHHINDMFISDKIIWIATDNGLICYNKAEKKVAFNSSKYSKKPIPYSCICSGHGGVWLGMDVDHGQVLHHFDPNKMKFNVFNAGAYIISLAAWGNYLLIAKTVEAALFNLKENKIKTLINIDFLMLCVHVGFDAAAKKGHIWFGSTGGGAFAIPFNAEGSVGGIFKLPQDKEKDSFRDIYQEGQYVYLCKDDCIEKHDIDELLGQSKKITA